MTIKLKLIYENLLEGKDSQSSSKCSIRIKDKRKVVRFGGNCPSTFYGGEEVTLHRFTIIYPFKPHHYSGTDPSVKVFVRSNHKRFQFPFWKSSLKDGGNDTFQAQKPHT